MRARFLAAVGAVVLVAACVETLSPPNGRLGFITGTTFGDGVGGYVTSPTVTFFDKTNLEYQTPQPDSCFIAFFGLGGPVGSAPSTVTGGEFVIAKVSGTTDTLIAQFDGNLRVYKTGLTLGIPFVPGDTLGVTISGSPTGFPASAISTRTSEAFTHDAVGVPATGETLPLTWTPAPEPGSLMTFSLRYTTIVSTGGENEQIFCAFTDDGSGTVPANLLGGWRDAVDGVRSVRAIRLRSQGVIIDGRTKLTIVSTFSQPLLDFDP